MAPSHPHRDRRMDTDPIEAVYLLIIICGICALILPLWYSVLYLGMTGYSFWELRKAYDGD